MTILNALGKQRALNESRFLKLNCIPFKILPNFFLNIQDPICKICFYTQVAYTVKSIIVYCSIYTKIFLVYTFVVVNIQFCPPKILVG